MKEFFYRPDNAWVGDVIPYFEDGEFKLFYLHGWRDNYKKDLKSGWYLLGTDDFVNMKEYGPCDIHGGTGDVIKVDGVYHLFYCTFPDGKQLVHHATGNDLMNWKQIPDDTFTSDDDIYELSDWRDPFVFWNDEKQEYWMLLTARAKGNSERKGCTALCTSKDLSKWEIKEPLYSPNIHVSAHECPDLFKIGDWWYLIYSAYTDRFATFYRMSRSLEGPWIAPKNDTFDGRAYYAAKSISDGKRRYLFGWNPTKTDNLFDWNPPAYNGLDYNTWDWGGNLVVHEIVQQSDGTLSVKVPDTVDGAFKNDVPVSFIPELGEWEITETGVTSKRENGFAAALCSSVPSQCRISAEITFSEHTQGCGFILRTDRHIADGYYLKLEPQHNRIVLSSKIMQSEEGGKTFSYSVELERPINLESGKTYQVKVFVDGTIGEMYVNDEVALSFRMYDLSEGELGLFTLEGSATFEHIKVMSL